MDLCVTWSYHVLAFTAMIIFTKYATLSLIYACFMEASSVLYSRFPPSTTATNIHLHPDYFIMFTCSLLSWYAAYSLNACQFRTMFYKLNYVESGLSRLWGGTGNSLMRFYDITSWSYPSEKEQEVASKNNILSNYRMFRNYMLIAPSASGDWRLSSIFQSPDTVDSTTLPPSFQWHNPESAWLTLCVRASNYRWCSNIDSFFYTVTPPKNGASILNLKKSQKSFLNKNKHM